MIALGSQAGLLLQNLPLVLSKQVVSNFIIRSIPCIPSRAHPNTVSS